MAGKAKKLHGSLAGDAKMMQIGICGTFDVQNYGDLLFPLIAEAELSRRLGPISLQRFSYFDKAPPDWPYRVTSVAELPKIASRLDGMIIGGGHLIRFDKDVAFGYHPPNPGIHHPTGYWLSPALICLHHGCPVVWGAPGALGKVPAWAQPLMHLAIGLSRYVAVRDGHAQATIAPFASGQDINLVPDTCFGVERILDRKRRPEALAKLHRSLKVTRPYILIQATRGLKAFARLLAKHRARFAGYQLVALPLGPAVGDDVAILKSDLSNLVELPGYPHPLHVAELIGGAAGVVGVSLHLAITAIALGVPVFRPAFAFEGKYSVLTEYTNVHAFEADGEIDPAWFEAKLAQHGLGTEMSGISARLDRHWDRIAACFSAGRQTPNLRAGLLWQQLSGLLESQSIRDEAAMASRNQQIDEQEEAISRYDRRIDHLNAMLAERDQQVSRQTDTVTERDEHIHHLNAMLAERDRQVNRQTNAITQRDEQINRLNAAIAERDRQVSHQKDTGAQRDEQINRLNAALAERDRHVSEQKDATTRRDEQLNRLNASLAERDRQLSEQKNLLAQRDEQLNHLNAVLAERNRDVSGLMHAIAQGEKQIASLNAILAERDQEISMLGVRTDERDRRIAAMKSRSDRLGEDVMARNENIRALRNSTSWKVTAPIRWGGRKLRGSGIARSRIIRFERIEQEPLAAVPYQWAVVDGLFSTRAAQALVRTYPRDNFKTVKGYDNEKGYEYEARALIRLNATSPSFPERLSDAWRKLADDLLSPSYRVAMTRLTGHELSAAPMEAYVCHYGPGAWLGPHLDLKEKIVTHVFYFNTHWKKEDGGCLNILQSGDGSDKFAEIAPTVGNSSVLIRSENSWHSVSRVADGCPSSRRSMNVIFYRPGALSTMWPPGDDAPLHWYEPPHEAAS